MNFTQDPKSKNNAVLDRISLVGTQVSQKIGDGSGLTSLYDREHEPGMVKGKYLQVVTHARIDSKKYTEN
jgi:hypothetical protein